MTSAPAEPYPRRPVGRPVEIEDEAIIRAGQMLESQGISVSGFRLRTALGNKGTPDRLRRVWEAHIANKRQPGAAGEDTLQEGFEPSDTTASAMHEAVTGFSGVVAELMTEVTQIFESRIKDLAALMAQQVSTQVHQQCADAVSQSVQEAGEARDDLLAAEERFSENLTRIEELTSENIDLNHRLIQTQTLAERYLHDATELKDRLAAAEGQIEALRDQLSGAAARAEQLTGEAEILVRERDVTNGKVTRLEDMVADLRVAVAERSAEISSEKRAAKSLQDALSRAETMLAEAVKRASEAEGRAERAETEARIRQEEQAVLRNDLAHERELRSGAEQASQQAMRTLTEFTSGWGSRQPGQERPNAEEKEQEREGHGTSGSQETSRKR